MSIGSVRDRQTNNVLFCLSNVPYKRPPTIWGPKCDCLGCGHATKTGMCSVAVWKHRGGNAKTEGEQRVNVESAVLFPRLHNCDAPQRHPSPAGAPRMAPARGACARAPRRVPRRAPHLLGRLLASVGTSSSGDPAVTPAVLCRAGAHKMVPAKLHRPSGAGWPCIGQLADPPGQAQHPPVDDIDGVWMTSVATHVC